jgi:hypothetical protein
MSDESEPAKSRGLDGAVLALILTSIAYVAAFTYEATYLSYFGIPIEFVDVTLRELLLYGAIAMGFIMFAILFSTIIWSWFPKAFPLALSQMLILFMLIPMVTMAFALLAGDFQPPLIAIVILFPLLSCLLFVAPIFRFSHIPGYTRRLKATYGGKSLGDSFKPAFLWIPVPRAVFLLAAGTVISILFAYAFGKFRARTQEEFSVLSSPDPCVVLRLSSEGYLCAGMDTQKRVALGSVKIVDPDGTELHIVKIGRIKTFATLKATPK